MLLVLADGRKLKLFVILERKDFLKEKLSIGIILKCNEKWWLAKKSRSNPERSLGQKSGFTSIEYGNAGFVCFYGSLN